MKTTRKNAAPARTPANERAKNSLRRVLANPKTAQRAMAASNAQSRAVSKILTTVQRLEGFITAHANLPAAVTDEMDAEARTILLRYYRFLNDHLSALPHQPTISVLLPVFRPDLEHLREALASVALQTYAHWQLCITDDASGDPAVSALLSEFAAKHPDRVRLSVNATNMHISGASNRCLAQATGEYVALLDQDDRLYPHSLSEVVRFINSKAAASGHLPEVMYSDERVIGPHGEYISETFFKPAWSPFLHLSVNYTTHLAIYRRELLESIGGFRLGFEGAQDHDLMLRAVDSAQTDVVAIPMSLYQWRSHAASTAGDDNAKPYAWDAGVNAVTEACERRGRPALVTVDEKTGHYRLSFELPDPRPRVSIVIPNKDSVPLIHSCITSIRSRSTYPDIEIVIVDNGSLEPETHSYYDKLQVEDPCLQVIRDDDYFNFARLNNRGVKAASGEFVVLLNNDTEVISPDWVEQMLMYAQFDEIGAVGAKLLYPDGTVQHGGVVGAGDRVADHAGWHTGPDDHLYIDMVDTVHESLAVTAAAMMIRRSRYLQISGLDEARVPNGYGDVDFCLRLRELGLTNLYTPYAQLTHYESVTRSSNIEIAEIQYMRQRWGNQLLNDPYVNPNLHRSGRYTPDNGLQQPDVGARLFHRWLGAEQLM